MTNSGQLSIEAKTIGQQWELHSGGPLFYKRLAGGSRRELEGIRAWSGYGFSKNVYPPQKVSAITRYGIASHAQMLVIIPDTLYTLNLRSERKPFCCIPMLELMEEDPHIAAKARKQARRNERTLAAQLEQDGARPWQYRIMFMSEFMEMQKAGHEDLRRIEQVLYSLYGPAEWEQARGSHRIERPPGMNDRFRNKMVGISIERIEEQIEGVLTNPELDARQKHDNLRWKAIYSLKQLVFTAWMVTQGYPAKLGPATEAPYDKTLVKLINGGYGADVGLHMGIAADGFGYTHFGDRRDEGGSA